MTTIVWDGTALAGDRLTTWGNEWSRSRKVYKVRDVKGRVFLFGACGLTEDGILFRQWLKSGQTQYPQREMKSNESHALIVNERLRVFHMSEKFVMVPVLRRFWAIGTGCEFALGALECGKSAADAVRIAARRDRNTGLGVDVVKF